MEQGPAIPSSGNVNELEKTSFRKAAESTIAADPVLLGSPSHQL
jgi:hypothetical protein